MVNTGFKRNDRILPITYEKNSYEKYQMLEDLSPEEHITNRDILTPVVQRTNRYDKQIVSWS